MFRVFSLIQFFFTEPFFLHTRREFTNYIIFIKKVACEGDILNILNMCQKGLLYP